MYCDKEFEQLVKRAKEHMKIDYQSDIAAENFLQIISLELHNIANELHEINKWIKRDKPSQVKFTSDGNLAVNFGWDDDGEKDESN